MKCECIGGLCCGGHGIKQREVLRQDSDRHQRALFFAVITLFDLEPRGASNATSTFAWANQQSTAASVIRRAQRPSSAQPPPRTEEHKSELQPLMRRSYAVFCLKK